jgi:hypothetical protein
MNYEEARLLIKDGDIISIFRPKHKFSLFANTISFFTQSPIYHTAIAVWLGNELGDKRLFVVEADLSNRRITPLSMYCGQEIHVLAIPEYVRFGFFSNELLAHVSQAKYGVIKAVEAGLKKYFLLPRISATGEICSELALRMWCIGGFKGFAETLLTPDQLEKRLLESGVKLRVIIDSD